MITFFTLPGSHYCNYLIRQVSELILGSVYASKLDRLVKFTNQRNCKIVWILFIFYLRVEQQVQYLTECRAAFSHLDLVHVNLVR